MKKLLILIVLAALLLAGGFAVARALSLPEQAALVAKERLPEVSRQFGEYGEHFGITQDMTKVRLSTGPIIQSYSTKKLIDVEVPIGKQLVAAPLFWVAAMSGDSIVGEYQLSPGLRDQKWSTLTGGDMIRQLERYKTRLSGNRDADYTKFFFLSHSDYWLIYSDGAHVRGVIPARGNRKHVTTPMPGRIYEDKELLEVLKHQEDELLTAYKRQGTLIGARWSPQFSKKFHYKEDLKVRIERLARHLTKDGS